MTTAKSINIRDTYMKLYKANINYLIMCENKNRLISKYIRYKLMGRSMAKKM